MSTDKYKHALIDPQLMMGHAPSKPKVRHIGADVRKCVNIYVYYYVLLRY